MDKLKTHFIGVCIYNAAALSASNQGTHLRILSCCLPIPEIQFRYWIELS